MERKSNDYSRELRHTRTDILFASFGCSGFIRSLFGFHRAAVRAAGGRRVVSGATRLLNSIRMYLFSELCM